MFAVVTPIQVLSQASVTVLAMYGTPLRYDCTLATGLGVREY